MIAGLLAAFIAVGVGQLLAGIVAPDASPIVAVGEASIDHTPPPVKNFAISAFGPNDKAGLGTRILAVPAILAAPRGAPALRRPGDGPRGGAGGARPGRGAEAFGSPAPRARDRRPWPTWAAVISASAPASREPRHRCAFPGRRTPPPRPPPAATCGYRASARSSRRTGPSTGSTPRPFCRRSPPQARSRRCKTRWPTR